MSQWINLGSMDLILTLEIYMDSLLIFGSYSTLGGKTGKLDEAVNRELNVTRS